MDKKDLNQNYFMRKFNDTYREDFNPDLFKRDNEELVEAIKNVLLSVEKNKYFTLKLVSFEAIYGYEEIYDTLRAHVEARRKKSDKTENQYNFININDSDIMLVKVRWYIRHNGVELQEVDDGTGKKRTIKVANPERYMDVLIALPRFVKGYYFKLSGNYYTTVFQIVDGSTYNNNNTNSKVDSITLKTMFHPMKLYRYFKDMVDFNTKTPMKVIEYSARMINNSVNAMLYLLANFGMYGASDFLEINCVILSEMPNLDPDCVCFEKNGIFISAPKVAFQDAMVQSFVATIYDGILKDAKIEDLFNPRYWLGVLGSAYKNAVDDKAVDKGLFALDCIDGIYDNTTKRDLHLENYDKESVYHILRWLMREFKELKLKENTDVRTKRIRIADYIAQVYATKLNAGIHRILSYGRKITLTKVCQAVYTAPTYVISNITTNDMSNLVSYRDLVNDGDALTALRFTYKGISGLGEKGGSVQEIYRHVDPSHLGILDLDSSSNSDPGMSGTICPMAKLYDNSFSEYKEPDTWRTQNKPLINEYKKNAEEAIIFKYPEDANNFRYYKDIRESIEHQEDELNKPTCPIFNIKDPLIDYSGTVQFESSMKNEKSLFTIADDELEDDDTHQFESSSIEYDDQDDD